MTLAITDFTLTTVSYNQLPVGVTYGGFKKYLNPGQLLKKVATVEQAPSVFVLFIYFSDQRIVRAGQTLYY